MPDILGVNRLLALAATAAALVLVACGDDDEAADPGDASAPAEVTTPAGGQAEKAQKEKEPKPGTEISVSSSQFGDVIFDGSNQAIYLFDRETSSTPECYGECAAAWPPVLTEGEPVASGAAQQKL